jgi:hypothetical protein
MDVYMSRTDYNFSTGLYAWYQYQVPPDIILEQKRLPTLIFGYLCRSVYNKTKTDVLVSVRYSVTENVTAFSYCAPYQSTILHMKYPQFTAGTYVTNSIAVESNVSLFICN